MKIGSKGALPSSQDGQGASLDADTSAYVAITRLQSAYADTVTRRAWPELVPLFAPDAAVHVDTVTSPVRSFVGPVAFGEFVAGAIEGFDFFEFVILSSVIHVATPDTARGRLYMVEIRHHRDDPHWSNAFGVYHDLYAHVDDRWQFAERHYRSLARTSPFEQLPFPASFSVPLEDESWKP